MLFRSGIGSHNLFDVSHTLLLRAHHGTEQFVDIEMLEGMANHQAKAVQDVAGSILLYAPIVEEKDFRSAIAYLIRRLDENTEEENFLHDLFGMVPGDASFASQADRFLASSLLSASEGARRRQDRASDEVVFDPTAPFANSPDTDFSLPANQAWANDILETWRAKALERILPVIDGEPVSSGRVVATADPSDPSRVAYEWEQADAAQVEAAIASAATAADRWSATAEAERARILEQCAEELERRRGDLIGAMVREAAKTIAEADVNQERNLERFVSVRDAFLASIQNLAPSVADEDERELLLRLAERIPSDPETDLGTVAPDRAAQIGRAHV